MKYRETADGKRQAKTLRALEKASGRKPKEIVSELPLGHDQYKRYKRGDTPMKWDQIPLFASAYGTSAPAIAGALGLCDEPDLRAALASVLPEDDAELVEHALRAFARLNSSERAESLQMLSDITVRKSQG